ncbi:MAG TPA: LuxR C-terminal-related transcriptional regulator [Thermohalobaculum sp.]|nr:LuxR C-terminal-related transcriptional regulator [Thermohalobaculum sp.]
MTAPEPMLSGRPARTGRTLALSGLLVAQAGCAVFFLFDVVADLRGLVLLTNENIHHGVELVAVLALMMGIGVTALEIRRIRARQKRVEAQLRIASGAFLELLEEHFDAWELTPSERDVAMLAIKGLSIADIARIRQTKDGTIKAQCNAIYSKAGVSGRQQLLSLFIEELMNDLLVQPVLPE